ncbi:MAG: TIGR04348 family glycosyltransferase [Planctomycetota bacterium]|nr:MAG: TIGR04348 family glycosyltransferase [Planctomycetota bacterium]
MKVVLVCPAPPSSLRGNRRTAKRWAEILQNLGHQVDIVQKYSGENCDLLVALHARKSHESAQKFKHTFPQKPLFVVLTGTDVYHDIFHHSEAQKSLELADKLIAFQPNALENLSLEQQKKTAVIYHSAQPPREENLDFVRQGIFEVGVVGHLRPVKDPFCAARALAYLPSSSQIQVVHLGAALSEELEQEARHWMGKNPRYRWLGQVPPAQVWVWLSRFRLVVVSSQMEGGANAISEAISVGTPVLASKVSGNVGMLAQDYPGYFPFGDAKRLAHLLRQAEEEGRFYHWLKTCALRFRERFRPKKEEEAWKNLLASLQS